MNCKLCEERGKTWEGSDPKCAFRKGIFDTYNWNCVTANALREIANRAECGDHLSNVQGWAYRDDNDAGSFGVFMIPETCKAQGYVVMSWYKNRGRVGQIWVMNDEEIPRPITLEEAEEILCAYSE